MSPTSYQAAPPRIKCTQLRSGAADCQVGWGVSTPPSACRVKDWRLCCHASTGHELTSGARRSASERGPGSLEVPLFRPRPAGWAGIALSLLLPSMAFAAAEVHKLN